MRPARSDLLIIGAGPAGTAAAIEAVRAGLSVSVIDKATFPRDKCCGDGLTAGALRHLDQLGLDPANVASWKTVDEVLIGAPNGTVRSFPLPRNRGQFAAITRRRELDAALVDLARDAGADVSEKTPLEAISQSTDRVTVSAGSQIFQARYVLAADGMWSPTRKLLGLAQPGYRGDWHAFRQYFRGVSSTAADRLVVWFEPDLLPGYFWSFPLADGSVNVGFGIQRGAGPSIQEMKGLWPELLDRPHIRDLLGPDAEPEDRHTAWPIPARLGTAPLTAKRVLFVGDAAAATDPMTGEGIGQALETGRLAARTIAASGSGVGAVEAATSSYENELRAGMVRDHVLARRLSGALSTPVGARAAIATAGLTPWTRRNFARWLFEDYPRAVLGTPQRWHRRLFREPGAYA